MNVIDSRTVVDFQKFTFSGHLRQHVYKVLNENIKLGHADYACYWALELLCSGLVHSMWQTLFESSAIHINRAAPNSFLYLIKMYEKFAPYESQYSVMSMTDIRNNPEVRTIICEAAATLALCRKHKLPTMPKIKPEHDFLPLTIQENLKSPSANYGRELAKNDDPLEIYIPFNELVYCLRGETRDVTRALYWCGWILKYSSQFKKQNKTQLVCASRTNPYSDQAYSTLVVWMLWEAVLDAAKKSVQAGVLAPYIDAVFKLHCLRWTPGLQKQRLCFLVTAIVFVCESRTIDIHSPVPHDLTTVQNVVVNIPSWILAIIQTKKTFS